VPALIVKPGRMLISSFTSGRRSKAGDIASGDQRAVLRSAQGDAGDSAVTVTETSALPTFNAILGTVRLSPGWTTMPVTVQVSKSGWLMRRE